MVGAIIFLGHAHDFDQLVLRVRPQNANVMWRLDRSAVTGEGANAHAAFSIR
jgi:hypothetical protein